MADHSKRETLGFQTEVRQLLHLMIHSLYSNKEIFLRELISNASDAADKLRFESLANPELLEDDAELSIRIEVDKAKGQIAIIDNGIGMSRDELVDNLGTIARSGTADFLQQMTGDQQHDAAADLYCVAPCAGSSRLAHAADAIIGSQPTLWTLTSLFTPRTARAHRYHARLAFADRPSRCARAPPSYGVPWSEHDTHVIARRVAGVHAQRW